MVRSTDDRSREAEGLTAEEAVVVRRLRECDRNMAWLSDHYAELRQRAAGCFVVIHRQRLVAHHPKAREASRLAASAGVDLDEALLYYIQAEGESWAL